MSTLPKVRKDIFSTTFKLMSANKKDSWKKQSPPSLSSMVKLANTILNVLRVKPSIF